MGTPKDWTWKGDTREAGIKLQMLAEKEQEQTKSFGPLREDHPRPIIIRLTDYGRAEKRMTRDV